MKQFSFLILAFFLVCCAKKDKIKDDDTKYEYPFDFINPKNTVDIQVSKEEEEILQTLSTFNVSSKYKDCFNESGDCSGFTEVPVSFFFNYTNEEKQISIYEKYLYKCVCISSNSNTESLKTIPLNQILRIDTLNSSKKDAYNNLLTTFFIYPKFDSEVINYKTIDRFYDKEKQQYQYSKHDGLTKNPIIFNIDRRLAPYLNTKLDKLISLNNPNYVVKTTANVAEQKINRQDKVLQSFTIDEANENIDDIFGASGCFYSETLEDNKNGMYYYIDDFNNFSVVKFNNHLFKFNITSAKDNVNTKEGFINAKFENYILKINKTPVFKNGELNYTKVKLQINNTVSGESTEMNLVGFCGC